MSNGDDEGFWSRAARLQGMASGRANGDSELERKMKGIQAFHERRPDVIEAGQRSRKAALSKTIIDRSEELFEELRKAPGIHSPIPGAETLGHLIGGIPSVEDRIEKAKSNVIFAPENAEGTIRSMMNEMRKQGIGPYTGMWPFEPSLDETPAGRAHILHPENPRAQALLSTIGMHARQYARHGLVEQKGPVPFPDKPEQTPVSEFFEKQFSRELKKPLPQPVPVTEEKPIHPVLDKIMATHVGDLLQQLPPEQVIARAAQDVGADAETIKNEVANHRFRGQEVPSTASQIARFLLYAVTLGPRQALSIFQAERHEQRQADAQARGGGRPMTEYERESLALRGKEFGLRQAESLGRYDVGQHQRGAHEVIKDLEKQEHNINRDLDTLAKKELMPGGLGPPDISERNRLIAERLKIQAYIRRVRSRGGFMMPPIE